MTWREIVIAGAIATLFVVSLGYVLWPIATGNHKDPHDINKSVCEQWVIKNHCDLTLHACIQRVKQKCY